MVAAAPTQDLPPRGGYAPIIFKRIPARTYFSGWQLFAGFLAIKAAACYTMIRNKRMIRYCIIEDRSAHLAIQPLIWAEKEREIMKQVIRNREEEEKVMGDVPDWEIGKYYDEPVYKTIPGDQWVNPTAMDYFAHNSRDTFSKRVYFHFYHY